MKNKLFKKSAVILAAMLSMSLLTACGGTSEVAVSENTTEAVEQTAEPQDNEETTAEETEEVVTEEAEETAEQTEEDTLAEETEKIPPEDPWSAKYIVSDMTIGWNLGNTFDAFVGQAGKLRNDGLSTENCWGNPTTTPELINMVKAEGFNVIRIPVTWYNHMNPDTYEIDADWMARVKEVVDFTIDDDTYVIVNMHHDTGTDGWLHASSKDLEWKKEVIAAAWNQIGTAFADYGDHLLFEGFNEVLDDNNEWSNPDIDSIKIINEFNQLYVDTVRATGGNNVNRALIVNTYCAGTVKKMLNFFEVPTDVKEDGIIVEIHSYAPYQFAAPEFPEVKTWSKGDVDGSIRDPHLKFAASQIPVIVGEFGCTPKNNDSERYAWAQYFVELAGQYGIPCIWWDNGINNEYGIFDRKAMAANDQGMIDTIVKAAGAR